MQFINYEKDLIACICELPRFTLSVQILDGIVGRTIEIHDEGSNNGSGLVTKHISASFQRKMRHPCVQELQSNQVIILYLLFTALLLR